MEFKELQSIFGEPKLEWIPHAHSQGSRPSHRFLFHVYAPGSSHLIIHVTDFHSNTWEAHLSVLQLEDIRNHIGIGGSFSEFVQYFITSINSEDVKLVLEGNSNSDGVAYAKLVAQKSKGMPVITIPLTKLVESAASEAMANLSLGLFTSLKNVKCSIIKEQERSAQLTKVISAEKERNETMLQVDQRQKFQKISDFEEADVSTKGLKNSSEQAPGNAGLTKVKNRVVPAYRRTKVRGALLQDSDDS
ncbi:hypothetical protein L6164_024993 [Bauhinia variegata]|uniref:Uncharacterized protein n=1 Tax=Bauhinia variegata TaxID=167791 RepID=A0ACB9LYX7_BAUVA|nr:hypothetical protein L6164_024993 [Bauhinia variegata]